MSGCLSGCYASGVQRTVTPEIVAEALLLRAPPEELSVRDCATRLGVGKSALAEALALEGAKAKGSGRSPIRKPPEAPSASQAPAIAHPASPPPKPPAPPTQRAPAPPPATLDADPAAELLKLAAEIRGRMTDQPAGSAEYLKLAGEARKVIGQAHAIQAKRKPLPTATEREEAAKPIAAEVLGKIRSGVLAWAQRDAETGKCCRCKQDIPLELVLRRRVEAGLIEAPT